VGGVFLGKSGRVFFGEEWEGFWGGMRGGFWEEWEGVLLNVSVLGWKKKREVLHRKFTAV
jgi:hypothetical protein